MTDLEITRLCAEAMGYKFRCSQYGNLYSKAPGVNSWRSIGTKFEQFTKIYRPLHDDAQAMALVKKFRLSVNSYNDDYQVWPTKIEADVAGNACTFNAGLNRAICECVAKMRKAK